MLIYQYIHLFPPYLFQYLLPESLINCHLIYYYYYYYCPPKLALFLFLLNPLSAPIINEPLANLLWHFIFVIYIILFIPYYLLYLFNCFFDYRPRPYWFQVYRHFVLIRNDSYTPVICILSPLFLQYLLQPIHRRIAVISLPGPVLIPLIGGNIPFLSFSFPVFLASFSPFPFLFLWR